MKQVLESLSVVFPSPLGDDLALLLWCVFAGVALVFLFAVVRAKGDGKIYALLLEKEAHSPEKAVSLRLRRVPSLVRRGEGEGRFYLPEESREKAQALMKTASTPLWLAILEMLLLYAVLLAIYYILPTLLEMF